MHDRYVSKLDEPTPNRTNEEQASRRILSALLVAGVAIASVYGLGMLLPSLTGSG